MDPRSNPIADPLQGSQSLGLYLVMCFMILALVLGISAILWRVHIRRRPRLVPIDAGPGVPRSNSNIVYLPSFPPSTETVNSINSISPLPAPLQAKKPIERLKLFRDEEPSGGSTAIPLWASPDKQSPTIVPAIVVSRCSPTMSFHSTFSNMSAGSTPSLQVPITRFSSPEAASISTEETISSTDSESDNTPLELTPIRLRSESCVPHSEKNPLKRFTKRTHRRSRPIGKENTDLAPAIHLSPNEVR
ncbi:hypothetical protein EIP86_006752 [Pleurotus ostreatoroseus]|nr:hypothetical protein EIP86_006752 [Pleurotus ostreatoroseus]